MEVRPRKAPACYLRKFLENHFASFAQDEAEFFFALERHTDIGLHPWTSFHGSLTSPYFLISGVRSWPLRIRLVSCTLLTKGRIDIFGGPIPHVTTERPTTDQEVGRQLTVTHPGH